MGFTLDDDIPPPTDESRQKYPFPDMKVGQSFFVAGAREGLRAKNASHQQSYRQTNGKYRARQVVENGVSGVRIWRVE